MLTHIGARRSSLELRRIDYNNTRQNDGPPCSITSATSEAKSIYW